VPGEHAPNASVVNALLAATGETDHPAAPGIAVIAKRSERIIPLAAELATLRAADRLDLPLDALAASYVHMWLNRLCRSQNTFYEYVTYALLARVLKAGLATGLARRHSGKSSGVTSPPIS